MPSINTYDYFPDSNQRILTHFIQITEIPFLTNVLGIVESRGWSLLNGHWHRYMGD